MRLDRIPRESALLAAAIMLVCAVPVRAQPVVTSDLLKIREATAIDVARDGSRAVYAVKSIAEHVPETGAEGIRPHATSQPETQAASQPAADSQGDAARRAWRYESHVFLLDLSDPAAHPRQLTFGERFDATPRLSPDGRRIAFVRSAAKSDSRAGNGEASHSQIWIMPVDGGEAWQLTDLPQGCDSPQWSPDGHRVLVTAEVAYEDLEGTPTWPTERPKRQPNDVTLPEGNLPSPDGDITALRAWLDANALEADPIVITRQDFQDELALRDTMRFRHAYVIDVPPAGGSIRPVDIHRAKRVTSGFADHGDAMFMPDGQSIVYAAKKPVDRHPDRVLTSDIWRVEIDGGNDRMILSVQGWALRSPKPSRDGAVIAFLGTRIDEPAFRQTQLGLAPFKGETASDPVWLTDETTFAASIDEFDWHGMQPGMLFTAAMRGGFPLMNVSPGLLQPAMLVGEEDGLPVGVGAFASGGGAIVCSVASASNPCVIKVRDGRGIRLAHDLNEWLHGRTIVKPVAGEITRPDGAKIQFWLMEPSNREPGRKYPLCLNMHGGPAAMWGPGEFTMWHEFQRLCSWGCGVVYCNPRGSGGYGYAFQRGNFQDWGEGPAGDVLAAVDHALMKEWVDPERLVITGGSYAGYLTVYVIAHDHRFKAAVAQRGVYDLTTFFGEGNAWRLVREAFGGNPYEARMKEVIARNNPFNHVSRMRTPLLIMHSSNDLRTGVSQSEMLYRALKELDKPVEYARYPNSGHDLSRTGDPRQRMDRIGRMIEFFDRFIGDPRRAPERLN